MLEKYFKRYSEIFAIPFIKLCIILKIKPNVLSFIGLIVIILGSYFFFTVNKLYGVIFIFLGSAIDGLDGPSAQYLRLNNNNTNKESVIRYLIFVLLIVNFTI